MPDTEGPGLDGPIGSCLRIDTARSVRVLRGDRCDWRMSQHTQTQIDTRTHTELGEWRATGPLRAEQNNIRAAAEHVTRTCAVLSDVDLPVPQERSS
eukprot:3633336-Rhodomonas_salina.1